MGRHSKQTTTLRKVAAVTAGGIGLAAVITGTASADPILGSCPHNEDRANPEVLVCHDDGYRGTTRNGTEYRTPDRIHALVKVDPLLCVHVIVDPEGNRRLVGTWSCDHHETPVTPVCPPCPPGTPAATTCPTPTPAPAPVTEQPTPPAENTPSTSSPIANEAPSPSTVVGGPVVTH